MLLPLVCSEPYALPLIHVAETEQILPISPLWAIATICEMLEKKAVLIDSRSTSRILHARAYRDSASCWVRHRGFSNKTCFPAVGAVATPTSALTR